MRVISTVTALLLFFGSVSAQHKIKVKINGNMKDSICYLAHYYGDNQYPISDSAHSVKGMIVFEGKKTLPGGLYLIALPGKKNFQIIVDKEQNFSLETDYDHLDKVKFKDSQENDLYKNYLDFLAGKLKKRAELGAEFEKETDKKSEKAEKIRKEGMTLDDDVKAEWARIMKDFPNSFTAQIMIKPQQEVKIPDAPKKPDGTLKDSAFAYHYYKAHYWDFIDLSDDRILFTPQYHAKLEFFFKSMIPQIPDSINHDADILLDKIKSKELMKYTMFYIIHKYENSNLMGMDAVYVHIIDKYFKKQSDTWLDSASFIRATSMARSTKPLLIGKKAPQLVLVDTIGNYVSMANIKAKYTVLIFWDPDCGHCQKEVPKLAAAYDSIKALKGEVFAVMCTPEAEKWKKFIIKNNLKWINVGDPQYHNNFREAYDIKSYPQVYILDENKNIIARKLGPEQVVDFLQHYDRKEIKQMIMKKDEEKE